MVWGRARSAGGNGRHDGGGLIMAVVAKLEGGWLRGYERKPGGLLGRVWALRALRFGWLRRSPVAEVRQTRRVEIRRRRPRPLDIDGELKGHTPVVVEIEPGAVAVFAPPRQPATSEEPRVGKECV